MPRMLSWVQRARDKSIWGPSGVAPEDDRLASLLRIYLPLTYAISGAFGVFGYVYGVPAIFDAITPGYAELWSQLVIATSAMCLVGVAFPEKLWRIDSLANSILVALFVTYSLCLIYLAFIAYPPDAHARDRAALAVGSLRLIALPLWRVFDIQRDKDLHGWS